MIVPEGVKVYVDGRVFKPGSVLPPHLANEEHGKRAEAAGKKYSDRKKKTGPKKAEEKNLFTPEEKKPVSDGK